MKKYPKYKPSNIDWIGDIPVHWEVKALKRLAKICNGQDHKKVWDENGKYPIIGTGGTFGYTDSYLHEGPSVILGRKGTIDKPMFYSGKIWTVDTLFYTHSFKNVFPKFIFNQFQRINWKEYNEASGVPSLSKSTIEKIEISIPCLAEQTQIANFLSAIDAKIKQTDLQIAKTEQWKRGLLQQMFV